LYARERVLFNENQVHSELPAWYQVDMTTDSLDLELLVAKIQQQLAPRAEVLHNVKLDGRLSKTKRQIDVLVRESIGQYDIQIIIDCKDYKKPVDVKGVEEFHGLFRDVGAHKGVLVSVRRVC
jgi:hypothetical protein